MCRSAGRREHRCQPYDLGDHDGCGARDPGLPKATFTATAQSPEGGDGYAVADTTATADGADLLMTHSTNTSGTDDSGGLTTMTVTSTTSLFALDIEALDLPVGTISVEGATWHGDPSLTRIIEDNVAAPSTGAPRAPGTTPLQRSTCP